MDIVVCIDKYYVMPTGVMMYSVCSNNRDIDITFHVIYDRNVTKRDLDEIKTVILSYNKNNNISFYLLDDISIGLPTPTSNYSITRTSYFRLFLTDLIPDNVNKILYMDGDVIVRHSLMPLWNTDISGYAMAAASDSMVNACDRCQRLGYPSDAGYFNSGVLLINLDYWRKFDISNKAIDYLQNTDVELTFCDQDVLNYLFWNKKVTIPVKYNLNSGFLQYINAFDYWGENKEVTEARLDPVIVHFAGLEKPWFPYVGHLNPYSSSFYKYQNQTIWKGCMIDRRPFKLRVKNYLALILRKLKLKKPLEGNYVGLSPID